MAERSTVNRLVVGSNPTWGDIFSKNVCSFGFFKFDASSLPLEGSTRIFASAALQSACNFLLAFLFFANFKLFSF